MLGTLLGVLEARGLKLDPSAVSAEVLGTNEVRDRLPVLTAIEVNYSIRIAREARDTLDRALERHREKCPTASTLSGAVEVTWTAEIVEED